jgi:hypothetical protein
MRMHDQRADVVQRDAPLFLAGRADGQKAAMRGEKKPLGLDINHTPHNCIIIQLQSLRA